MAANSNSEKSHNKDKNHAVLLNKRISQNQDAYDSFMEIDAFLQKIDNSCSQSDCFSKDLPELAFNPFFDEDPDDTELYSMEGDKI